MAEDKEKTSGGKARRRERLRRMFMLLSAAGVALPALAYARLKGSVKKFHDVAESLNDEGTGFGPYSTAELQRTLDRLDYLPRVSVHDLRQRGGRHRPAYRNPSHVPVIVLPSTDRRKDNAYTMWDLDSLAMHAPNAMKRRLRVTTNYTHPKIVMHELGHAKDVLSGKFDRDGEFSFLRKEGLKDLLWYVLNPDKAYRVRLENSAWDNARIPKGDQLRDAAVKTYVRGGQLRAAVGAGEVAALTGISGYYGLGLTNELRGVRKEDTKDDEEPNKKGKKDMIHKNYEILRKAAQVSDGNDIDYAKRRARIKVILGALLGAGIGYSQQATSGGNKGQGALVGGLAGAGTAMISNGVRSYLGMDPMLRTFVRGKGA